MRRDQGRTLWEITVEVDESANPQFYSRIDALPNARFVGKSDRVLNRHRGGKIRMHSSLPITTTQILRDVYTPGVARVCLAIRDDPAKANLYTNLPNTVAVVTNGTAVLGLGDIGPLAGLPVMEGKAALFADAGRHHCRTDPDRYARPRPASSTRSPRSHRPSAPSSSRTSRLPSASRSRRSSSGA